MKDNELADAAVALGVGNSGPNVGTNFQQNGETNYFPPGGNFGVASMQFVRDGQVATAMLEQFIKHGQRNLRTVSCTWHPASKLFEVSTESSTSMSRGSYNRAVGESLPRTILEVCVEAYRK